MTSNNSHKFVSSRAHLAPEDGYEYLSKAEPAEGGCGVIGMASSEQVAARHMLQALSQMRNRGNGKGGGIAAAGLVAEEFGVSQDVLENDYLLAIAYLDESVREQIEKDYIYSVYDVDHVHEQAQIEDFRDIDGLDVKPPFVVIYFVRIKPELLQQFKEDHDLLNVPQRDVEDEFVYQNSFKLNTAYYASLGEKQAFVLSHGKNLLVLKMVGYGDDVIRYYQIEDMHAHVWIGHHRYPTKGRVWHPGGAHPFIGLNEALVHNGDFANHASISEYLAQRNIFPLFLTDTEVAVQVFDLLYRTYKYPLEYVIEAMAPTTERDFTMLPAEKQRIYQMLQATHMHSSPDGPWFFLIAQSEREEDHPVYRLTGITDTSMLRPQVFAYQQRIDKDGHPVAIGFAASEKQGIDAALSSLAAEDKRFWSRADRYWNARGGSHTDGGAFLFSVHDDPESRASLVLTDKFGRSVPVPTETEAFWPDKIHIGKDGYVPGRLSVESNFVWFEEKVRHWNYNDVRAFLASLEFTAQQDEHRKEVIEILTRLIDRHYDTGLLRRSSLLSLFDETLARVFAGIKANPSGRYAYHVAGQPLPSAIPDIVLIVDARGYEPEGKHSLAREIQRIYDLGYRHIIIIHAEGHRFVGNGLGSNTDGLRIDVYGSSGDYLASGMDGIELHVHNNAQDQLAQIMKSGRLVVYGDVGQTFMYGAKGGEAYILGNAAGRPLINAVGKPRVVINGTSLDYLAESFMAGDPLNGGGFVILNGINFNEKGDIVSLDTPYPGGNLFSLASGGAIYLRDPRRMVTQDQLNGGEFAELSVADWNLIESYLHENARLFGISIDRLLEVDGIVHQPQEVYRKIQPAQVRALQAEEAWVTEGSH
ncbi:MAG: glutamate synthase [Chloroflexi bacterium]|nr:MAG: glutamate synthase [Chloroflexota bacterium]MBL1196759.1 glutamate synthase [Chloroflexota bacterium]NOH14053.1 glutamate synthase [Chloroflexota bacterium]